MKDENAMKNKIVNPKYKMDENKKTLEEEIISDTEMTDDFEDHVYKRYKIMNYEVKDSIEELKSEADKIVLDVNTTGSAVFDGRK